MNRFQYAKDTYFLTDFSSRVAEYDKIKSNAQEIIKQQEIILATLKEKIKKNLELNIQSKIKVVETELRNYSDSQAKLNFEIEKRGNELTNLE